MDVQCCVCKKLRHGSRWVPVADSQLDYDGISHGYCPKCAAKAFEEIRRQASYRKLPAVAG